MGGGESHNSNVARMGQQYDIIGNLLPKSVNPHTYLTPIADKGNEYLGKVTKPVNKFNTMITPGKAYLDDNVPILKAWNQTVENRPIDAAAIAAASIFGGGALMGGGGIAGMGSTGATSATGLTGAGSSGGLSSILGGMSTMQKARLANSLLNYAQQQGTRR